MTPVANPVNDFTFYWYAARQFVSGLNPYVPAPGRGYVMFSPPWSLPLIAPLGWMPLNVAQIVWTLVSALLFGIALVWLWEMYGDGKRPVLAALLVGSFTPVAVSFVMGQLAAVLLFALAGFLRYESKRPYLAGAFLVLFGLKPHLIFLVWPAMVLCALLLKRWKPLVGFLALLVLGSLFVSLARPGVWFEWWSMFRSQHAAIYETPTLGTVLRHVSGWDALQYVPLLFALAWFSGFVPKFEHFSWRENGPMLVFVSLLTAPYAWYTDQVLLIPVLFTSAIAAAKSRRTWLLISYLATNLVGVRLVFEHRILVYAFIPWVWLELYGIAKRPRFERSSTAVTCAGA